MPAEPPRLRCLSFHSVKGGVGKSTLSVLCARELARTRSVVLVDMDLTGTSLADVLPLRPPRLEERDGKLILKRVAGPEWTREQTRALIDLRAQEADPIGRRVPFLNDVFLYRSEAARLSPDHDVDVRALLWRHVHDDRLSVLPSSALPNDLERILPLIYDDLYAGFLEARLEWLLSRLLEHEPDITVVFDSPPTIPGLSAALLSLAMRLPERTPLATDVGWAGTPLPLRDAGIRWTPVLVTSADLQDLRATDRWLRRAPPHERDRFRVVVNRTDRSDVGDFAAERRRALAEEESGAGAGLQRLAGDDVTGVLGAGLATVDGSYDDVVLDPKRVRGGGLYLVPDHDSLRLFRRHDTTPPAFPPTLAGLLDPDA